MPERKIDPKFNIHASYRTVNILNPYRYSGNLPIEPETEAYMIAASIPNDQTLFYTGTPQETTGSALWDALNKAVYNLKAKNLLSRIQRLTPRIGGSALAHSIDLITGQAKGSYQGGWIHDGRGSIANGSDTYYKTGFNAYLEQVTGNSGMTAIGYSYQSPNDFAALMGAYIDPGYANVFMIPVNYKWRVRYHYSADVAGTDINGRNGVITVVKNGNSTPFRFFHNGVFQFEELTSFEGENANLEVFEGAFNNSNNPVIRLICTIGTTAYHEGFTDNEIVDFQNILNELESDLGRNV